MKDESRPIKIKNPLKYNPLESTRSDRIVKFLNIMPDCKAEKRVQKGFSRKGDADIFGCIRKFHFELEVKKPKKTLTVLQKERRNEWHKVGAITGRVENIDDVREVFKQHGIII
jgi:hypothetical protein